MKLNLNAEELLALHNLLRDTLDVYDGDKESMNSDKARLRPVYNRVRAHFVAALSTRGSDDALDAVMSREQSKIDRIRSNLDDVKKEHNGLADALKDKDYIVPGLTDDLEVPDYPKRPRRSGGGRHQKR